MGETQPGTVSPPPRRRRWVRWAVGLAGLGLLALNPVLLDTVQNALLPGSESRDTADLEPQTRRQVDATLAALRRKGWPAWVRATRRDAARQAVYKRVGFSKTLRSRHRTGRAADLNLALPWVLLPLHVAFFKDLRETALAQGLCSGGTWLDPDKGQLWARVGLGWDPAHVERCR